MSNASSIVTILSQFPQHIKELLIGQSDSGKCTEVQLIALGDRVINLIAVLGCEEYQKIYKNSPQNDDLDTLIHNIVTEQHGLSHGASYCIINEFRKEVYKSIPLGSFAIDEDVLSSWISLRNEIRKAKRIKQLFLLGNKLKELVIKLLDTFYKITFSKKANVLEDFLNHPEALSDRDFIIYAECIECGGKHIFIFDRFTVSDEDFSYCNWGLFHTLHVSAKSPIGSKLKRKYWGKIHLEISQVNIFPLFADSYS